EVLARRGPDHGPAGLTRSIRPPLLGMLSDRLLRARYLRHLDRLVELAEKEERRTRGDARFHRVAEFYLARFYRVRAVFLDEWQQDLVAAFRTYQERGLVDVITCGATHGFLPRSRQLQAGVERRRRIPRRFLVPRLLSRYRLRPRLRLRPPVPPAHGPAHPHRSQIPSHHRQDRPEGALRPGTRPVPRAGACRPLRRDAPRAGRVARAPDGASAH